MASLVLSPATPSEYIGSKRPWLSLYGVRLKPPVPRARQTLSVRACDGAFRTAACPRACRPAGEARCRARAYSALTHSLHHLQEHAGLIERLLPDEILLIIMSKLPPADLGVAACVCSQWQRIASAPTLWQAACLQSFGQELGAAELRDLVVREHRCVFWRWCVGRPSGVVMPRMVYGLHI